jgi:acetyl esterase/lipase
VKRAPAPVRAISYGKSPWQFGEFWAQPSLQDPPFVILVHGGFWRPGRSLVSTSRLAKSLHARGCAVWNVEYGIDSGPGGWRTTLRDVALGLEFGLDNVRPGERVDRPPVLAGHSAGGQLALVAGRAQRVSQATGLDKAVFVGLAPVTNMPHAATLGLGEGAVARFMGVKPEEDKTYDEVCPTRLLPIGNPILLLHGRRDGRVPLSMSEDFIRAARRSGDNARLITLAYASHASLTNPATRSGTFVVDTLSALASAYRSWDRAGLDLRTSGSGCLGRRSTTAHNFSMEE